MAKRVESFNAPQPRKRNAFGKLLEDIAVFIITAILVILALAACLVNLANIPGVF